MAEKIYEKRNHEITAECSVPSKGGIITEPGWARTGAMKYSRENIKAPWYRRKEWDYYLFNTDKFAVAFTISDLGYLGLLSASFIDLESGTEHTESEIEIMPKGKKYSLGIDAMDATANCHTKRLDLVFSNREKGGRHISCNFRNFDGDKMLTAELDIYEPDMEAIYITTPWAEKQTAFYYNCKHNCLEAEGTVTYGERTLHLTRADCLGCLDWGRGVWTYDNTWYWGTGSGRLNGELFGFNLGYGFSDRSSASENGIYFRGRIHKLNEITFNIPTDTNGNKLYTNEWTITSDDGRFEGAFIPILDRSANMDFKVIISTQHQVFGRMNGFFVTDEGEKIEFNDFTCALEEVRNRY